MLENGPAGMVRPVVQDATEVVVDCAVRGGGLGVEKIVSHCGDLGVRCDGAG